MGEDDVHTPIRLADIIPLAFKHGGMTPSGLRREAARGNLTIMRMAGKDFTTLADIEEMKRKCRVSANQQDSGSVRPTQQERPRGLSSMEEINRALDALLMTAKEPKERSRNTSRRGS